MATTTGNPTAPQQDTPRSNTGEQSKQFIDKAKDMASNVADKAREAASNFGSKARDTIASGSHHAESAIGSGIHSLGGSLRENLPQSGMLGSAGSSVADALESSGRYIQEEGLAGMADDMMNMIRRNPIPAVMVGVGIGVLLAFAFAPSSRDNY